jgi:FkbM family methyltransferase
MVARSLYGQIHWNLRPRAPLRYRLPTGGTLMLDPDHSFTKCFWPAVEQYEPDVRAALLQLLTPGATFIDCGANVGYFSVLAADIVGPNGRIVAIEANPITYRALVRNLEANCCGTPVHCALMAEERSVELFVPRRGGDVYSSLRKGGLVNGEEIDAFRVRGRTLDGVVASLELDRVDVLKIDIEGGELEVLRSARRLLETMRPVVVCEYGTNTWPSFGATPHELVELLTECRYTVGIFDLGLGRVVAVDDDVWTRPYVNLILLPGPIDVTTPHN